MQRFTLLFSALLFCNSASPGAASLLETFVMAGEYPENCDTACAAQGMICGGPGRVNADCGKSAISGNIDNVHVDSYSNPHYPEGWLHWIYKTSDNTAWVQYEFTCSRDKQTGKGRHACCRCVLPKKLYAEGKEEKELRMVANPGQKFVVDFQTFLKNGDRGYQNIGVWISDQPTGYGNGDELFYSRGSGAIVADVRPTGSGVLYVYILPYSPSNTGPEYGGSWSVSIMPLVSTTKSPAPTNFPTTTPAPTDSPTSHRHSFGNIEQSLNAYDSAYEFSYSKNGHVFAQGCTVQRTLGSNLWEDFGDHTAIEEFCNNKVGDSIALSPDGFAVAIIATPTFPEKYLQQRTLGVFHYDEGIWRKVATFIDLSDNHVYLESNGVKQYYKIPMPLAITRSEQGKISVLISSSSAFQQVFVTPEGWVPYVKLFEVNCGESAWTNTFIAEPKDPDEGWLRATTGLFLSENADSISFYQTGGRNQYHYRLIDESWTSIDVSAATAGLDTFGSGFMAEVTKYTVFSGDGTRMFGVVDADGKLRIADFNDSSGAFESSGTIDLPLLGIERRCKLRVNNREEHYDNLKAIASSNDGRGLGIYTSCGIPEKGETKFHSIKYIDGAWKHSVVYQRDGGMSYRVGTLRFASNMHRFVYSEQEQDTGRNNWNVHAVDDGEEFGAADFTPETSCKYTPSPTYSPTASPTESPTTNPTASPTTSAPTPSTCSDGARNGFETNVDCGGSECPGCALGLPCTDNNDCDSGFCPTSTSVCSETQAPTQKPSSLRPTSAPSARPATAAPTGALRTAGVADDKEQENTDDGDSNLFILIGAGAGVCVAVIGLAIVTAAFIRRRAARMDREFSEEIDVDVPSDKSKPVAVETIVSFSNPLFGVPKTKLLNRAATTNGDETVLKTVRENKRRKKEFRSPVQVDSEDDTEGLDWDATPRKRFTF